MAGTFFMAGVVLGVLSLLCVGAGWYAERTANHARDEASQRFAQEKQTELALVAKAADDKARLADEKARLADEKARLADVQAKTASDTVAKAVAAAVAPLQASLAQAQATRAAAERALAEAQARLTWRRITPAQKQRFIDAAHGQPLGNVLVSALADDPEAEAFASEIMTLLSEAGFTLTAKEPLLVHAAGSGVALAVVDTSHPPAQAVTLQQGLKELDCEALGINAINADASDVVEVVVMAQPKP